MEREPFLPSQPLPNNTEVFISGEKTVGRTINGWISDKPLEIASTDEEIPTTVLPPGTPFNSVVVLRTQSQKFEVGSVHSFATYLLQRIDPSYY